MPKKRRYGHPLTDVERKKRHKVRYGTAKLPLRGTGLHRSKRRICYKSPTSGHVRCGYPVIHVSKTDRKYIMVRKRSGGVRRLYLTRQGNIPKKHRP